MISKLKEIISVGLDFHKIESSALTAKDYKNKFNRPESVINHFMFQNYDPVNKVMQFKDGFNGGVLIEAEPISSETKTDKHLLEQMEVFTEYVKNAVQERNNPWVTQTISYYDNNLTDTIKLFDQYNVDSKYKKHWRDIVTEHIKMIESDQGVFREGEAQKPWKGKKLRVYIALYRVGNKSWDKTVEELKEAKERLFSALKSANVRHRTCLMPDYINLLLPWITPNLDQVENINDYLRDLKITDEDNASSGSEKIPLGFDIGDLVAQANIESLKNGMWKTGDKYQAAIPINMLTAAPEVGHLTRERSIGGEKQSLLEMLPTGTRWVTTIIHEPQTAVKGHLANIQQAAGGNTKESDIARREANEFSEELAKKNKGYNVTHTCYLTSTSEEGLETEIKNASSILRITGLPLVDFNEDIYVTDAFIRNLPFNYDVNLDKTTTQRRNLTYADHVACLLPFYGRARGTGNAAVTLFNAGGESLTFDPIKDRSKNAHMEIFGPPGSGKSALLNNLAMSIMGAHNARLVIVDCKWPFPSFYLLAMYFESQGLKVNHIRYDAKNPVSTPPFKMIRKLFNEKGEFISAEEKDADFDDEIDILGQVSQIAETMVTDEEKLPKKCKTFIRRGLINAGQKTFHNEVGYPLVSDLIDALEEIMDVKKDDGTFKELDDDRKIIREMTQNLELYTQGINGEIFNQPGAGFGDADVILIELAILTQPAYEEALCASFMSIIQNIQALAMDNPDGKDTVLICDETHVVFKFRMLALYLSIVKKVFRAAGIWLWSATQDFEDVPKDFKKMINNSDWFIGLSMSKQEIETLSKFKELSEEQIEQIKGCNIEKGKYAEMVVICDEWSSVARGVYPPITLALAQTEKDERHHRFLTMKENNFTNELEAVKLIEQEIIQNRKQGGSKEVSIWQ